MREIKQNSYNDFTAVAVFLFVSACDASTVDVAESPYQIWTARSAVIARLGGVGLRHAGLVVPQGRVYIVPGSSVCKS